MLQQYDRVVQERDQTVRELEERLLVDPISQNLQQDPSQSRLNTHRNLNWELNNSQSWTSNLVRELALVQDLCHEREKQGHVVSNHIGNSLAKHQLEELSPNQRVQLQKTQGWQDSSISFAKSLTTKRIHFLPRLFEASVYQSGISSNMSCSTMSDGRSEEGDDKPKKKEAEQQKFEA